MANVGTAYVAIVPTMKGAASAITKQLGGVNVKSAGTKIGAQLTDGIGTGVNGLTGKMAVLGGAVGGAVSTITDGLINAVTSLGSEMVSAADGAQKFASTLSFAGVDTSTIDALTKSTQAYADATVYDLNDIRSVTAQLAANGVDNYAQLAEAAGNLNAVAGGNADTFKSVGMVMTQTAGSGKLMTENWNQLTDAIPGASGALQDAMREAGAFEGNFREAMERGEISADEFFAAVQKLGMTDVAIQAATSTSTIEGALGNLKASVVNVGSQVVTALTPAITGAMTMLSGAISQLPAMLQIVGAQAATVLQPLFTTLQGAWTSLQPMMAELGASLMALFQGLSTALQPLMPMLVSVATTIVNIGTQLMSVLMPILTQIITFVAGQLLPVLQPAIQAIVTTVQTAMPLIQTIISNALNHIQAVWNAVWPVLQSVIVPIFNGISTFIQGAMNVIQGIINVVLGVINGDWSTVMNGLQQIADGVWQAIQGIVEGAVGAVQGFIESALSTIQGIWNDVWNGAQELISSAWESIKSAVSNGVDNVISTISSLPGQIMGFFADAGTWLVDAGSSIIQGLVDGITGAIGGAISTISGAVSQIRDLFPFSPAKKGPFSGRGYTTYSGIALMRDFGKGISHGSGFAVSAMTSAMEEVYGAHSAGSADYRYAKSADLRAVSNTPAAFEQTINFNQPVQTPYQMAKAMKRYKYYGLAGAR